MTFPRPAARTLTLAAALSVSCPAWTQQPSSVPDPANLTGEHISPQDPADTLPIDHGAPRLQQLLLKLRTRASLMMIVAHPDDEDSGMLTYESRGLGARVAMLTLTRGEGGQNLMSADFDDALGLIRTQELLAADRYLGVDQMFGTEVDFGFSKTKEESFQQWTHDRVLYDAVRAVRLYRPLVLTSVFVGGPTDGHGHHQVSGEISQEVFKAAADPKVFPDMGLPSWAPLKVYARVPFSRITPQGMFDYATGKTIPLRFENYVTGTVTNTEPRSNVLIHEGAPAVAFGRPALGMDGMTYVQFGRLGLGLQKTQIGNDVRLAPAGAYDVGYTRYGSRLPGQKEQEESFFDGIDTSLPGIAALAPAAYAPVHKALEAIDARIASAQTHFKPDHPEDAAPALADALRLLNQLLAGIGALKLPGDQAFNLLHELRLKHVQLNDALALALSLTLHPQLADDHLAASPISGLSAGETVQATSGFSGSQQNKFFLDQLSFYSRPQLFTEAPATRTGLKLSRTLTQDPPLSRPYFFRPDPAQPFYDLRDPALRNAPATPPAFVVTLNLTHDDARIEVQGVIVPPSAPEQTAKVVPELSVRMQPTLAIDSTRAEAPLEAAVTLRSSVAQIAGTLRLTLPAHWASEPAAAPFALTGEGTEQTFHFTLVPEGKLDPNHIYRIAASAEASGHTFTESFRPVGYPGLTLTNLYAPAVLKVVAVNVVTAPNLRVAYMAGTGDTVPEFLPGLGVQPAKLTVADLTPDKLSHFDAVVLGVRAYAAHPELAGAGSRALLDYARGGGTVIVQYNVGGYDTASAPYPITVPGDSAHNVVVEAQPVTILDPAAPVLNWPNRITPADFDHWIEERGHGFAATWAPEYTPLLETHDPDQDPQRGGLLVARVGKGTYTYMALALYRQLPEGVPGAYRLFANLLSLGKNPSIPH